MQDSPRDQINSIIIRTRAIASTLTYYFSFDGEKDTTLNDDTIAALAWQVEENLTQIDTLLAEI